MSKYVEIRSKESEYARAALVLRNVSFGSLILSSSLLSYSLIEIANSYGRHEFRSEMLAVPILFILAGTLSNWGYKTGGKFAKTPKNIIELIDSASK